MYGFQVGDILETASGALRARVLSRGPEYTWLYDLKSDMSQWPFFMKTKDLLTAIEAGETTIAKSQNSIRGQSDGDKTFANIVFKRLNPVLSDITALMTTEGRSAAYKKLRKDDVRLAYTTFKRLLHAYFSAGGLKVAIVGGRSSNGKTKISREVNDVNLPMAEQKCREQAIHLSQSTSPLGRNESGDATAAGKPRRRRRPIKTTAYRVDEYTLCVFRKYYKKLSAEGLSLPKVHKDMCIELFSVQDALGKTIRLPRDCIPSLPQFRNWYHCLTNYKDKRLNQIPEQEFATEERELIGNEFSSVSNVGDVGSGDATIWNVGLRSRFATREIIGPPVVFRLREKKSGMLLGISISLEAASWRHFASAIANCFEDKVKFCAKYGISIRPEDWPVKGLPKLIEADCGESDNTKPEHVCEEISLGFKNIMFGRPDQKPGVESDFNTLQVTMNGDTPGACVQRWQARGKHEWRTKAVLDIDQFMRILLLIELERMRSPREKLLLPDELIADRVDSSPLSLWNWYVEHRGGGLRSVDPQQTILALMEKEKAAITRGGVIFKGLIYKSAELSAEHALARAGRYGQENALAAFDYRLVDEIFVMRPDRPAIRAVLSDEIEQQLNYFGKSFREVKSLRELSDENEEDQRNLIHALTLNNRQAIKDIIDEAAKQTDESASVLLPPATQLKGLKAARAAEEAAHSPGEALYAQPAFEAAPRVAPAPAKAAAPQGDDSATVVPFPGPTARPEAKMGALAALLASMPSNRPAGKS